MKRTYFIMALVAVLAACRQQEPQSQLKEINEALELANGIIEDNNRLVYEELNNKLPDPRTHAQALVWQPKAEVIRRRALASKRLIDSIKAQLIRQSDSLKMTGNEIVEQVITANEIGGSLFDKLVLFEDSMACVFNSAVFADNSNRVEALRKDSLDFYKYVSHNKIRHSSKKDWIQKSFSKCSPLMAVLALNKEESNLIGIEKFLIDYCNLMAVDNYCGYDRFGGIASINSSVVKPGDTLVITAGVGAFSNIMYPRITIDGWRIKLNDRKIAKHTFFANERPGTYTVPVKIEFMDADGSKRIETNEIRYTVIGNK
jgi:hypothetical protein